MASRGVTRWMLPAFGASGAAALGFQLAWTRLLTTVVGHETPAVLAVMTVFFLGMAGGAVLARRVLDRCGSAVRGWLVIEVVIGVAGVLGGLALPWVGSWLTRWWGPVPAGWWQWCGVLVLPGAVLLPATLAMGMTFPAMDRLLAPHRADRRVVGALYAANTLGAVAGVLLVMTGLLPALGLRAALVILPCFNAVAAILVAVALRSGPAPSVGPETGTIAEAAGPAGAENPPRRVRAALFLTGVLGIGFESVGLRILSQLLENTVFTYALALAVFLLGTALGGALFQYAQRGRRGGGGRWWLAGLVVAVTAGAAVLGGADRVHRLLLAAWGGTIWVEVALSAMVFLPPAVFMGAVYSHLMQAARRMPGGLGTAAAWNLLGCAAAAPFFGLFLHAWLGPRGALIALAAGYLLLPGGLRGWGWLLAAGPLALAWGLPSPLRFVPLNNGDQIVFWRDGVMASVAVVENRAGERTLRVNQRFQMGGTSPAAAAAARRQAHVPLLLHPAPRHALFLGVGTGVTLGAVASHPGLSAEGIELVPEIVEALPWFTAAGAPGAGTPALRVAVADARRYVRGATTLHDVIVADLFHPAVDGAGALYTREHFAAIRARLAAGGVFAQWLPVFQLDEWTLRVITRTFLEIFPDGRAWLLRLNVDTPVLGLIHGPARLDLPELVRRMGEDPLRTALRGVTLGDPILLLGSELAGPAALQSWSAGVPVNTDNHPVVVFAAPRMVYRPVASPPERLQQLLRDLAGSPGLGLDGAGATNLVPRLAAFARARDVYLNGLVDEAAGRTGPALDAFVESARLTPDFTFGYARVLALAMAEAGRDRETARQWLRRLIEAQPAQPRAREMLERLDGGKP